MNRCLSEREGQFMKNQEELQKLMDEDKVTIVTGLSTGQMIEQLRVGDEAEYKYSDKMVDYHLIVQKLASGAIVVVKNGDHKAYIGQELVLNAKVMSYTWTLYSKYVSFYEAMKAHEQEKKTITYHQSDELKYTFVHELVTGQFEGLSNDNLCLYELIEGKWTIDN